VGKNAVTSGRERSTSGRGVRSAWIGSMLGSRVPFLGSICMVVPHAHLVENTNTLPSKGLSLPSLIHFIDDLKKILPGFENCPTVHAQPALSAEPASSARSQARKIPCDLAKPDCRPSSS
jgi:hypothetical protein